MLSPTKYAASPLQGIVLRDEAKDLQSLEEKQQQIAEVHHTHIRAPS